MARKKSKQAQKDKKAERDKAHEAKKPKKAESAQGALPAAEPTAAPSAGQGLEK
jgi:hypothetical protein